MRRVAKPNQDAWIWERISGSTTAGIRVIIPAHQSWFSVGHCLHVFRTTYRVVFRGTISMSDDYDY